MNESIRTFVAIELPEDIQAELGQLQAAFKKSRLDIRWVRPENIHLTLKFLGNVRAADIRAIGDRLAEAAGSHEVFELHGAGIGVFPNIRNPRVLWAGIGGGVRELQALKASLEDRLSRMGIEKEGRPFKGHLTLGRSKGKIDSRRLMDTMAARGEFSFRSFSVRQLTFFRSDLRKGGPVYTRLMTKPLADKLNLEQ